MMNVIGMIGSESCFQHKRTERISSIRLRHKFENVTESRSRKISLAPSLRSERYSLIKHLTYVIF